MGNTSFYSVVYTHFTHIVDTHAVVERWQSEGAASCPAHGAVGCLVPCSRAPWQCPGGELEPLQLPVHFSYFGPKGAWTRDPSGQAKSWQTAPLSKGAACQISHQLFCFGPNIAEHRGHVKRFLDYQEKSMWNAYLGCCLSCLPQEIILDAPSVTRQVISHSFMREAFTLAMFSALWGNCCTPTTHN